MVVFGQKLLYSSIGGCLRSKVDVFGQSGVIPESGFIRSKVRVILPSLCIRAKKVVFWQKWLYSLKSGSIRAKWLYSEKSGCI